MSRLVLGLLAAVALVLPAKAALPPQYQRAQELRAVIDAAQHLLNDPIEAVEFVRTDLYRLRAGRCSLAVRIIGVPSPQGLVGPRTFKAEPDAPECS